MQQFKIRCSAIHDLMAGEVGVTPTKEILGIIAKESKGDKLTDLQSQKLAAYNAAAALPPELPTGAKTYCRTWWTNQRYGKYKQVDTKYMAKGNTTELDAIRYAEEVLGYWDWEKNEQHFSDEYMTGTPDVLSRIEVVDMKNSYDCWTFPLFDEKPQAIYVDQLQGYMHLTGKKKAILVYALMDLPDALILKECWFVAKARGLDEVTEEVYEEVKALHTYSHLPPSHRIKAFYFDYDPAYIEKVQQRVLMARDYIATLDVHNVYKDGVKTKL